MMTLYRRWTVVVLLCFGAASALADSEDDRRADRGLPHGEPERYRAVQPPTPAVTGEVPDAALARAQAALRAQLGIADTGKTFRVRRAQAVRWPDGALGCGQPGEVYPAQPMDGYHIVLQGPDGAYDYRLAGSILRRCALKFTG